MNATTRTHFLGRHVVSPNRPHKEMKPKAMTPTKKSAVRVTGSTDQNATKTQNRKSPKIMTTENYQSWKNGSQNPAVLRAQVAPSLRAMGRQPATTALTILQSKNYDQFVACPFNRDTNQRYVKRLINSMNAYGFLHGYPLHCWRGKGPQKGKLIIKDGQRRFEAAAFLGLPIAYVINSHEPLRW